MGGPVDAAVNVRSNGNCITFASTGFTIPATGALPASRAMFCDDRGEAVQTGTALSDAREIEIINVGRSRITREPNDFSDVTYGTVVTCP